MVSRYPCEQKCAGVCVKRQLLVARSQLIATTNGAAVALRGRPLLAPNVAVITKSGGASLAPFKRMIYPNSSRSPRTFSPWTVVAAKYGAGYLAYPDAPKSITTLHAALKKAGFQNEEVDRCVGRKDQIQR